MELEKIHSFWICLGESGVAVWFETEKEAKEWYEQVEKLKIYSVPIKFCRDY